MAQPIQEEIIVLFHASLVGRTDVVQNAIATIKRNGDLDDVEIAKAISTGRSEDNATPLHIASNYGHTDVIRALLNAGADATVTPSGGEFEGMRPYELANDVTKQTYHVHLFEQVAMGNADNVARLIGYGSDGLSGGGIPVDVTDDSDSQDSALHWAASFGSVEVAEVLLQCGCFVDVRNNEGQTPLHLSCKAKNLAMVELLLDEGADPTAVDKQGNKPLDMIEPKGSSDNADENGKKTSISSIKNILNAPPKPSKKLHKIFIDQQQHIAHEQRRKLVAAEEVLRRNHEGPSESASKNSHVKTTRENKLSAMNTAASSMYSPYSDSEEHHNWNVLDTVRRDISASSQHSGNNESSNDKLLVFWPPVKHQERDAHRSPLVLNSSENLQICVGSADIDIFPLLTWSGLMDAMDTFGFQVQVKRSSCGAKIRLVIDSLLCPTRHSYSLRVGSEQILLVAADDTGLLYGAYTLIQLLQLHSEVRHSETKSTKVSEGGSGKTSTAMYVIVPPVLIRDFPDVADRGVLWSHRHQVRTAATPMREHVELLSRLHINKLFLVLDNDVSTDELASNETSGLETKSTDDPSTPIKAAVGAASPHPTPIATSKSDISTMTGTKIYALDEVCKRHCVDLIPTLIIRSLYDRPPIDVLKNFSMSIVSVIFAFDYASVAQQIVGTNSNEIDSKPNGSDGLDDLVTEAAIACRNACETVLRNIHLAGITSAIIVSSDWTEAAVDPVWLAGEVGLHAIERDFSSVYPTSLFSKPIISGKEYIQSIYTYFRKVSSMNANIAVFPAYMDRDFLFPSLLIKFYCFLFAGFAWNCTSVIDMLGNPFDNDFSINTVREIMSLTIFNNAAVLSASANLKGSREFAALNKNDITHAAINAIMMLMTGAVRDHATIEGGSSSDRVKSEDSITISHSNLFKAEKLLWALVTAEDDAVVVAAPTRIEVSECMKFYRRLLNLAEWKPDSMSSKSRTPAAMGMMSFVSMGVMGMGSKGNAGNNSPSFSRSLDDPLYDGSNDSNDFHNISTLALEIEEIFCVINLMSVISKCLVFAYKAYQKQSLVGSIDIATAAAAADSVPYHELLSTLSVGTKSDTANSILTALSSCTFLWRRRFDRYLLKRFRENNPLLHATAAANQETASLENAVSNGKGFHATLLVAKSLQEADKRFFLQDVPVVPGAAVFAVLSKQLPLPQTVDDFIRRLFTR